MENPFILTISNVDNVVKVMNYYSRDGFTKSARGKAREA